MQTVFHFSRARHPALRGRRPQAPAHPQAAEQDELSGSRSSFVSSVRYERDGDVGLVVIDSPPLDLFGDEWSTT